MRAPQTQNVNGTNLNYHVDDFPLEQVFRNIFENSLAAYETVPSIQIECAGVDDIQNLKGNGALKIAIQDNGPGIAAKQRLKIFEPFFSTKQKPCRPDCFQKTINDAIEQFKACQQSNS